MATLLGFSLDFGPNFNQITGDNGAGKPTIAEAIVFALFGVTLAGFPRCDNLIRQGANGTMVEVVFNSFGESHMITRFKTKVKGEVLLDGAKATQETLFNYIGLAPHEFLAAFNPSYLLNWAEAEPGKARQFIARLLPRLNILEVMDRFIDSDGLTSDKRVYHVSPAGQELVIEDSWPGAEPTLFTIYS